MPSEVATALLLSSQSMTNRFKKVCQAARQRIVEPVSRSTALPISAPKTGEQRLGARLKKATAAQLQKWSKRTLARGNRLMDARDKISFTNDSDEAKALVELLGQQISAHDRLGEALHLELTSRATRGIGYKKPIKFEKI